MKWWWRYASWVLVGVLACSSESEPDPTGSTIVTRVEVTPGSLTLDGDDTQQLTAQAFNEQGQRLRASVTWSITSTNSNAITLSADGLVSAQAVGSAKLIAEADGVRSAPVLVLVVQTHPNSVFVVDDQIVGDFELADPNAPPVPGLLYDVTLQGVDVPEVGSIVIGSGEKPLGGRVESASQDGDLVQVRLQLLTLDELFAELKVDQNLELKNADFQLNDAVASTYTVGRLVDGSYEFTPISSTTRPLSSRFGSSKRALSIGPIECEAMLLQNVPLMLNTLPASFNLDVNLDFIINYDSAAGGLQKLAIGGDVTGQFSVKPTLTAAIDGSFGCEVELMVVTIPVGGPLALFFGGNVPLGAGFGVGGKITLAEVGAEVKTEAKATGLIGFECPGSADCTMLNEFDVQAEADYMWILPASADVDDNLRFEAQINGNVFFKAALGSSFFSALRFEALKVQGGITQSANLATVVGQIRDPGYKSGYKLSLDLSAGLASDAQDLFDFLSINVASLELKLSLPLFETPKAASIRSDTTDFAAGDVVSFDLKLDPSTLSYQAGTQFITDNVEELVIYRRLGQGAAESFEEVARATGVASQTEYSLDWTASDAGVVTDNFFAFVDTKALTLPIPGSSLDFPFIDELELGKVAVGDASSPILVAQDLNGSTRYRVVAVSPDGSDRTVLTGDGDVPWDHADSWASWSPDRSQIAFARSRESNDTDIWVMNADGSNQRNLTEPQVVVFEKPSWSPDGSQLAVHSTGGQLPQGIYLMDTADGGNLTRIVDSSLSPAWSPDGAAIAFARRVPGEPKWNVYTMRPDGTGVVRLTDVPDGWRATEPSWSPDGSQITYSLGEGQSRDIWVMNADGSSAQNLSNTASVFESLPSFSPDGQQIVAVGQPSPGSPSLVIMNADGTGNPSVIPNTEASLTCSWFQ